MVALAALAMATLVLVPPRYRYWRLVAVLGWVVVWFDGQARLSLLDLTGLGLALGSLVTVVALQRRRPAERPD